MRADLFLRSTLALAISIVAVWAVISLFDHGALSTNLVVTAASVAGVVIAGSVLPALRVLHSSRIVLVTATLGAGLGWAAARALAPRLANADMVSGYYIFGALSGLLTGAAFAATSVVRWRKSPAYVPNSILAGLAAAGYAIVVLVAAWALSPSVSGFVEPALLGLVGVILAVAGVVVGTIHGRLSGRVHSR